MRRSRGPCRGSGRARPRARWGSAPAAGSCSRFPGLRSPSVPLRFRAVVTCFPVLGALALARLELVGAEPAPAAVLRAAADDRLRAVGKLARDVFRAGSRLAKLR